MNGPSSLITWLDDTALTIHFIEHGCLVLGAVLCFRIGWFGPNVLENPSEALR